MFLKRSTRKILQRGCWLGNQLVLTVRKVCCQSLRRNAGMLKPSEIIVSDIILVRAGFTSKLEGMFKDMELSRDINSAFKQHVSHLTENDESLLASDRIDLTVSVLSMAFWPTYPVMNIIIPPYMMKYQDIFNKFYQVKFKTQI